jgi:hypothetical protein
MTGGSEIRPSTNRSGGGEALRTRLATSSRRRPMMLRLIPHSTELSGSSGRAPSCNGVNGTCLLGTSPVRYQLEGTGVGRCLLEISPSSIAHHLGNGEGHGLEELVPRPSREQGQFADDLNVTNGLSFVTKSYYLFLFIIKLMIFWERGVEGLGWCYYRCRGASARFLGCWGN